MAAPKSVMKIDRGGVQFISNVDRTQYTLTELSRAALRDVARLLRYRGKQYAPEKTGALKSNVGTWVRKASDSDVPYLQFGLYDEERAHKKGLKYAFYGKWQELGSSTRQAYNDGRGFLRPAVQDSIDDIRRIQGKYLSEIERENRAMGLIDESEEISND